jgi:cell division protein FtsB
LRRYNLAVSLGMSTEADVEAKEAHKKRTQLAEEVAALREEVATLKAGPYTRSPFSST